MGARLRMLDAFKWAERFTSRAQASGYCGEVVFLAGPMLKDLALTLRLARLQRRSGIQHASDPKVAAEAR
jgi:hypothetical protein